MTIFENDLDLETIQKIEKSQADRKEILARLNARAINSKENQFIEDIKKIDFAIHYLQRKEWELEYAKKELEKCKNELLYADHGSILANKALPQLIASLPQIVTAILAGIGKAALSIVEVGKNIVLGLWDGIASMITWVKDKISGFVGDIVGGIKGLLGIRSPSAVFAEMGTNKALDQMRAIEKVLRKKVLKNDEEIENDL